MSNPQNIRSFFIRLVVKTRTVPVDLSIDEIRQAPTLWLKLHELEEKLIKVDFKPAPNADVELLKMNITKAIKRAYKNVVLAEFAEEPLFLES